jgi:hypothetical protein
MMTIRHFINIVESAGTITAYHGTFERLRLPFRPLSHFGSMNAAQDRLKAVQKTSMKAARKLHGTRPMAPWLVSSMQHQARRAEGTPTIYRVTLSMRNPVRIKDSAVQHSPRLLAFALNDAKVLTREEMLSVSLADDDAQAEQLIGLLRAKGYDGIVYKNRYEDRGSDSYVILDATQIIAVEEIGAEPLQENAGAHMSFGDLPDEVQSFITDLTPDDVGREIIDNWIVRFEGFSDLCIADADERCTLPPNNSRHLSRFEDVHAEVSEQWERDEARPAVISGVIGHENPVQWAVFGR